MSKVINKWIGAYDGAKRLQGSGWSETDVLAKAQELFACGKNVQFTLMEEWQALRNQPCYGSQVGGNIGSGTSARPMGREAAKKRVKRKARRLPWRRWKRSGFNSKKSRSKRLNN